MEVSVYDRMCWPAGELERALRLGSHRRELAAFLGHAEYALLRSLAGAASARHGRRASGPRVYILPGIMGSRLGMPRGPGQPMDLLWVDPADIVSGRLRELRWGAQPRLQSLGAIDYSYLPLKLRLQALGYDVSVHDYDWRQDLRLLGTALASRLRTDGGRPLALVGHSMGGLLARVALAELARDPAAARVIRVVCLGTPHGGSLAAVHALRASYPVVLRLAAIDGRYDARHLSRSVFASFMSLYQLLPHGSDRLDLFDAHAWPADGAGPRRALLATARGFAAALAPVDERFAGIVGTGQRTVTGIERRGGQFHYEISAAGDGTVPVRSAALPGARNYYRAASTASFRAASGWPGLLPICCAPGARVGSSGAGAPAVRAARRSAMPECGAVSPPASTGRGSAPPGVGAISPA